MWVSGCRLGVAGRDVGGKGTGERGARLAKLMESLKSQGVTLPAEAETPNIPLHCFRLTDVSLPPVRSTARTDAPRTRPIVDAPLLEWRKLLEWRPSAHAS